MKTVYLSGALAKRHPKVYDAIADGLRGSGIPITPILNTRNIWIRDYAPIKTALGNIRFDYKTVGYDKWPDLEVGKTYLDQLTDGRLPIALDGGNVVQSETHVLITEMVFNQNPKFTRNGLSQMLEGIFQKQLVILPVEPGDTLGHSDGFAAFAANGTVLINDYDVLNSHKMDVYQRDVRKRLQNAGLKVAVFPFGYHRCPKWSERKFRERYPRADNMNPAVGYYINFLHVGKIVLLPVFGQPEDDAAITEAHRHFPKCQIVPIECFDLAMTGGMIHCVCYESDSN